MNKYFSFALLFISFSSFSNNQPILIQGAMDSETDLLIKALDEPKRQQLGAWSYWEGTIADYPVVISRTEIGIANAAASTTLGIEHFAPLMIINQGTSGGHDPKLFRGDIVIGKASLNIGAYKTQYRAKGQGIKPLEWNNFNVVMRLRDGDEFKENKLFSGDQYLVETFTKEGSQYKHGKVVQGIIGTADEWNREVDRITWFHETLGTSVEEMETSAAALVAKAYDVPFVSVRVLSNTDQHKQEFDPKTATYCQQFVLDTVNQIIKVQKAKNDTNS